GRRRKDHDGRLLDPAETRAQAPEDRVGPELGRLALRPGREPRKEGGDVRAVDAGDEAAPADGDHGLDAGCVEQHLLDLTNDGVSVSALSAERATDTAIVSANCR